MFESWNEVKIFFNDVKLELAVYLTNSSFIDCLAYLVDIFGFLNTLHLKYGGKKKNVVYFLDLIRAFIEKLLNWRHRVQKDNFAVFSCLADICK